MNKIDPARIWGNLGVVVLAFSAGNQWGAGDRILAVAWGVCSLGLAIWMMRDHDL